MDELCWQGTDELCQLSSLQCEYHYIVWLLLMNIIEVFDNGTTVISKFCLLLMNSLLSLENTLRCTVC